MAYVDRYDAALSIFIGRYMRGVHTNIRGKITEVDYGNGSVSVQPTAFTQYPSGTIDKYSAIHDVPLQLPTGNNGKAFLSMPVKPGDMVGLAFSERNEDDNTDTGTHEMSPGWATTHGLGRAIDPENVVLANDKGSIVIKPAGDISLKNPKVTAEILSDGNVSIDNGAGKLSMDPSGMIGANGAKITPAGKIITAAGVDLDDFYQWYIQHVHDGVERGDASTNKPVGG